MMSGAVNTKEAEMGGTWQVWSHEGQLLLVGPYAEANRYARHYGISPLNVVRGGK